MAGVSESVASTASGATVPPAQEREALRKTAVAGQARGASGTAGSAATASASADAGSAAIVGGSSRNAGVRTADEANASVVRITAPDGSRVWRLRSGAIDSSADNGGSWQSEFVDRGVRLLAGSAPSSSVCWVAGANGLVLRRTANGRWQRAESVPAVADLVAIQAVSDTQATVTTADRVTYRTQDAGRTWQIVPSSQPSGAAPPR